MKRASYREGIYWLAANDDTDWVHLDPESGGGTPSVTACLLADLFDVDTERVRKDVLRELDKQANAH